MKDKKGIERRQFLKLSSTAVLAGLAGRLSGHQPEENLSIVEEAARKVGKLPRRKLGYSQREITIIIGAGDLELLPTEAGVLCGMNYWHKANRWMKNGAPGVIIKNRDAHYLSLIHI